MDTSNSHLLPQTHVFRQTLSLHTEGAAWAGQAKPNARATSLGEANPSQAQLGQTQGQEEGGSSGNQRWLLLPGRTFLSSSISESRAHGQEGTSRASSAHLLEKLAFNFPSLLILLLPWTLRGWILSCSELYHNVRQIHRL